MSIASLIYRVNGKKRIKKIKVPVKRYHYGIYKQREGYVQLGGWNKKGGKYISKSVSIPKNAGLVRLKIGKKVVSKAR